MTKKLVKVVLQLLGQVLIIRLKLIYQCVALDVYGGGYIECCGRPSGWPSSELRIPNRESG